MDALAKERDLVLQQVTRFTGLGWTAVSLAILFVPGVVHPDHYLYALPLYGIVAGCLFLIGTNRSLTLVLGGVLAGLGLLAVLQVPLGDAGSTASLLVLLSVAAGVLPAFSMVLMSSRVRVIVLVATVMASVLLVWAAIPDRGFSRLWLIMLLGWALPLVFGYWFTASVPRAARRIYSIGRAHRAERRASETEAQRRQSARLLHDTVLATLTLLAHSGVGVSPEALRQQATDDARLLRQLRLGMPATPQQNGQPASADAAEDSPIGTTLQSVKHRFGRMGLDVSWHGTAQVMLPGEVLDAFLLAIAECLENVRRHSGVTAAHVTITEDESTVRAMVTDSGVGFDVTAVDEARIGLKESVVGRLAEVGGNARLFSAIGAGTTVVLEVPR